MTEEEYQAGVKSVRDKFKAEHGREMEFEDWVKLWGGRQCGQSIVEPRQHNGRTVLREGEQT